MRFNKCEFLNDQGRDWFGLIYVSLWLFCTDPVQASDVPKFSSALSGVLLPYSDWCITVPQVKLNLCNINDCWMLSDFFMWRYNKEKRSELWGYIYITRMLPSISEVITLSSYCPHLWKRENMTAGKGNLDIKYFGTLISLLECSLAIGC